ncbi:MAG: 2-isopropylmalate synthase [Clostridiales bacterium]|jgi:2-isopropylmalate synthase|nr:2-isopropylmalate synthase [Clostridiales bacterium]
MKHTKYKPYPRFDFNERTWPLKYIEKAPAWCSVDLRDGNQALQVPMDLAQKVEFFKFLVEIGFREIEIGFPAASDTEYIFTRKLIDDGLIPDGVAIQVLTQARGHIMEKTFEALGGVKKAVVHLYNSTSVLQRDVVFKKSRQEVRELAEYGARRVLELAEKYGRERFVFEYSPESFTGTEMDYAAEVCNAVIDIWKPSTENKCIINLPSTVEMTTPNVYADQIEYICNSLNRRDSVIVSLHTHNDRSCAVAASELGLLAGADRVEGTLFGNGERTGNADIMVIAMNMYSQGIDTGLDFSDIERVVNMYESSTMLPVHDRHPYAGSLVFTAFSGSHQDAIKKGMANIGDNYDVWEVPYLPIDPADLGRSYEAIIRINSQSGKGGVGYVLERKFGIVPPKPMLQEFGGTVTRVSDQSHKELEPGEIYNLFEREYINLESPAALSRYSEKTDGEGETAVSASILVNGEVSEIAGSGNGVLDAFCKAVSEKLQISFDIENYNEHSLELGSKSRAITYMNISDQQGKSYFGAGVSSSITKSSIKAVISAINRMLQG